MMKNPKQIAEEVFRAGIAGVLPHQLIANKLSVCGGILSIGDFSLNLALYKRIFVIGGGKASALMAQQLEVLLGERITDGHLVVKYDHSCPLKHISITEAGHPLPDEQGVSGTRKIMEIASLAQSDDLVICLLSGGASALLADVPQGISLHELIELNQALLRSGASIHEMNAVRKHLSLLKGGGLAQMIYPAQTLSLILSDVVGDSLEVIASGPTYPDSVLFSDALKIIEKYHLWQEIPASVLVYLRHGELGYEPETLKADDPVFDKVKNFIIGSNRIALEAAAHCAKQSGFEVHLITDCLYEDYRQVAAFILESIQKYQPTVTDRPVCLLMGGEPTVQVTGNGLGGRNQHLALYLATLIRNMSGITILCGGTDGTDGPTDAAGAVVDECTCTQAEQQGINPDSFLERNDAYHFFDSCGGHLITGSTGTNVMDMIIILINK